MPTKIEYMKALNQVWRELKLEKDNIAEGYDSPWPMSVLSDVVQPEIKEMLHNVGKGEIVFKYGENLRKLQSTMLMEGAPDLLQTDLGKSIIVLQGILDRF